ncbi:hypothetical protein B566_EDAN006684 [Ephemera danica]|nr:hypothetical protein B566_EDAN006684 [Ephemera danica]
METLIEKDTTALGSLFQQIITDLKNGAPLWEDFVSKATKLHSCLRATLQAVGLYLEAFQKIADAATSSREGLILFHSLVSQRPKGSLGEVLSELGLGDERTPAQVRASTMGTAPKYTCSG